MTTTQNATAAPATAIDALLPHLIQAAVTQARSEAWMDDDRFAARSLVRVLNTATVRVTDGQASVRLPLSRVGRLYGHKAVDLLKTVVRLLADTPYALPANARVDQVFSTEAILTW